jgi:hypothetical protein
VIPLGREDVPVRIEDEGIEFRTREVSDMTVGWVRLAKGANLAPALQSLTDDLCPCPHWGYVVSGRVRMQEKNGESVYEAGQAFYWAPGHAPEALEDCEYIDFCLPKDSRTSLRTSPAARVRTWGNRRPA